MNLALGTVQFGLNYGISNDLGQVSAEEANNILTAALKYGIKTLDCAAAYGTSEQLLGNTPLSQKFNIVTKIPPLSNENTCLDALLQNSLNKLKCNRISTLLLHDANDLITSPNRDKYHQQLTSLKQQNIVDKIGISVYSPKQLEEIIASFNIDTVQLPLNFFDQRFLQNDLLDRLKQKNITVHARSVFLQGLLLMEQNNIPDYFQPYRKLLHSFIQLAAQLDCKKTTLALAILVQNPLIDNIVVGCCTKAQLDEIIESYHLAKSLDLPPEILRNFSSTDLKLINPSLWCLDD